MKNVSGLVVVLSGKRQVVYTKWPYLDKDGLPEALDWTIRIVSARSSFLAYSVGKNAIIAGGSGGRSPPSITPNDSKCLPSDK